MDLPCRQAGVDHEANLNEDGYGNNMNLDLFKPQEYPVYVGNPESSSALCIVWQSLDVVVKYNPWIREKFAIVGNLRSPFGLNVILYNLARNPHIRNIYLWGPDKLSNTPIGVEGKNTFLTFWNKGVDQNHQVIGHSFKFVDEIDVQTAELIRNKVVLNDISNMPKISNSGFTMGKNEVPYMKRIQFKPFAVKAPDTYPSEKYIYPIRANTGANGYISLLSHIWRYGMKQSIDRESEEVREIRGAVVVIENENPDVIDLPEWLTAEKAFGISQKSLDIYYQTQFISDPYLKDIVSGVQRFERPKDYSYLYAELIFAHPRPQEIDDAVFEILRLNGYKSARNFILKNATTGLRQPDRLTRRIEKLKISDKKKIKALLQLYIPPIDQVANVIDRIRRKEQDLDKEIVLWNPWLHSRLESGRPCLNKLSFSVRGKILDVHVFARSHDIGKAWFFNYYGVTKLLGKIAKETGLKPGYIIMESESAHIYQRDWDPVRQLIEKMVDKKDPRMFFDPQLDIDPRGVLNIEVLDNRIQVKLLAPKTGYVLSEFSGRTARELLYKIKHLHLLSRVDHGVFIGGELTKAELCMKLNIQYKYDNPITLPSGAIIAS